MSSLVYSVANPFLVSVKNQAILKEADISTDTAVTRQSAFSFAQQIYGLKETGGCQIFLVFFFPQVVQLVNAILRRGLSALLSQTARYLLFLSIYYFLFFGSMFFALSFNRLSTERSALYCRKPITMAREKKHSEIDSVGVGAMTYLCNDSNYMQHNIQLVYIQV